MKTYIIINGKNGYSISTTDIVSAKAIAIRICDCSKEIIVREIKCFEEVSKLPLKE